MEAARPRAARVSECATRETQLSYPNTGSCDLTTITDVAVVSRHRWDEMHPYTAEAASELGVRVYTVDDTGAVREPRSPFADAGGHSPPS
jgi:hypothetical protein